MRSAPRRTAAVLMMALVAMLLVAVGGSARGTQHRVSAGPGQAAAAPHPARQIDIASSAQHEQPAGVLDLASTPPPAAENRPAGTAVAGTTASPSIVTATEPSPTGRAPPAP